MKVRRAVESVAVPVDGLLAGALPRVDYADAYRATLEGTPAPSLDELARALLGTAPGWVEALMRLRNTVVRPFGLKTGPVKSADPATLAPGARVGIFCVLARREGELLLGEDDRHLDFRVSLRIEEHAGKTCVVLTTVVCFHNWFGRAYFVPVAPMHRLIVPAMITSGLDALAAIQLASPSSSSTRS